MQPEFRGELAAHAWLWKDHTGHAEAAEITEKAAGTATAIWPSAAAPTAASGTGRRSCTASGPRPKVFEAAYSWVELADFVPAFITGNLDPDTLPRGICAAGHKAMYQRRTGAGCPAQEFLARLDPGLAVLARALRRAGLAGRRKAGGLTAEVAEQGRPAGRAWPWPSGPSTPTWARSARASSPARW